MNVGSPGCGALLVEPREGRDRQVDLAAHLDQRRRRSPSASAQRQRDRATVRRFAVTSSPTIAVAAGRAAHEARRRVDERDGQAVDLRLGDVARRLGHAGGLEQPPHALRPRPAARRRRGRWRATASAAGGAPRRSPSRGAAADALGGRVGRDQVGVGLLERRAARATARRRSRRRRSGCRRRSTAWSWRSISRPQLARSRAAASLTPHRPGSRPAPPASPRPRRALGVRSTAPATTPQVTPIGADAGGARRPRCRTASRPRSARLGRRGPSARAPSGPARGAACGARCPRPSRPRRTATRRRLDREGQVDRVARLRRRDADRGAGPLEPHAAASSTPSNRPQQRGRVGVVPDAVGVVELLRAVGRRTPPSARSAGGRSRSAAPRRAGRRRAPCCTACRWDARISAIVSISVPSRSKTTARQRNVTRVP